MSYYSNYGGVSFGVGIPIIVLGCLCWGIMRRCSRERWKRNNRDSRLGLPPASNGWGGGHENAAYLAGIAQMVNTPTTTPRSNSGSTSRDNNNQSDVYVIPTPATVPLPPPYSECVTPKEAPPPYVP